MANPISGRQPDTGDLARLIGEQGRAIAQLQRLMANRPKIPAAAAGGIVGQAEFFANPGTVGVASGVSYAAFTDITYGAVTDPTGGSTPDWVSFDPVEPYRIFLEPDCWYGAVMYQQLSWGSEANTPESFSPYMQGGADNPHQGYSTFARARLSFAQWGLLQAVDYGLVKSSSSIDFHAECRFGTPPGADADSSCFVGWVFTKFA